MSTGRQTPCLFLYASLKCLKRKLKLKGEMYVIRSKILFLQLKRCLCQLEMKAIDYKKWIYEKVYGG